MMDKFMISVKLQNEKNEENVSQTPTSFALDVSASQRGGDLRGDVARLAGKSPGDIKLIFAGKLLGDSHTLKDLNIAEHTTVHAVVTERIPQSRRGEYEVEVEVQSSPTSVNRNENRSMISDQGRESGDHGVVEGSSQRPGFYVYCRSHCQSVQSGKLRVRCSMCQDDAFVVDQDPSGWDDVSLPGRISGRCLAPGCEGTQAQFYFKCASHMAEAEEHVTALRLMKTNTREVVCLTCAEIQNPVLVFPCTASHVICLDCFSQYCHLCLDERRFVHTPQLGYTLPCPAGCADSLINETHHFLVLGKEQYTRYKRFGAEEYLLQEGGVFCPAPGCGAGILLDMDIPGRKVVCHHDEGLGCGFEFCRDCHEAYHEGDCDVGRSRDGSGNQQPRGRSEVSSGQGDGQARWELEESRKTIQDTSKPCPSCRVPVERNGGCMHMTCSRAQCKFEWCWLCGVEWNVMCMADHWFGTDLL